MGTDRERHQVSAVLIFQLVGKKKNYGQMIFQKILLQH